MSGRDHCPFSGISIRAGGLASLGLSWLCGRELWLLHSTNVLSFLMFLLALMTFLAASAGSAMLIVGPHLFDEVEVADRWRRLPVDQAPISSAVR
jgi:hypothetical protein